MIVVPPGNFLMGTAEGEFESALVDDGRPQHRVRISHSFAVSKFEITREEYAAFVASAGLRDVRLECLPQITHDSVQTWENPGFIQTGNDPVTCVNWFDAVDYARWLSEKTKQEYRLLSEAEWEYAARAGTTTKRFWGDSTDEICKFANSAENRICQDGHGFTAPVGSFVPNAFGLYDMLGNVWEWVADDYQVSYEGAPADGRTWEARRGLIEGLTIRGGSWRTDAAALSSVVREGKFYARGYNDIGIRVARALK